MFLSGVLRESLVLPVIPSEALHRIVQVEARNLLLVFFSQRQIPRRFAPRNDRVGMTSVWLQQRAVLTAVNFAGIAVR
jgi:hypothetical protein